MRKILATGLLALAAWGGAGAHVWDELAILARPNSEGTFTLERYCFLQPSIYTNAVFFDYDNDGNLDLLLMGQGGDWNISGDIKFLLLYRNMGAEEDYRFSRVTDTGFLQYRDRGFINPLSTGDYNHDGYTDVLVMNYQNGAHVDLYLNDGGTGRFIRQDVSFEGVSNGSVMFGDVDNDGWLDIAYSGDGGNETGIVKIYRNRKDGGFEDATPEGLTGVYQGQSTLADIDGDGRLDLVCCGLRVGGSKTAALYMNRPAAAAQRIVMTETVCGFAGAAYATPLVADFNADGRMDVVINGQASDGNFRNRFYYQQEDGTFALDTAYPVVPVNQDGGINMGDADGDGNMDIIAGGYIGNYVDTPQSYYSSPLRVFFNRPERAGLAGNTFPEAPAEVCAEQVGDEVVISWSAGSDKETAAEALRYNLYVKNETTGELFTLIPADLEDGRLKVGTDLQTSLSASVTSYRMSLFGSGRYTVGVQTLDQSYAGSPFKVCTLDVTHVSPTAKARTIVSRDGQYVRVQYGSDVPVCVYNVDGRLVCRGQTNDSILLPQSGMYLINVGGRTEKVML